MQLRRCRSTFGVASVRLFTLLACAIFLTSPQGVRGGKVEAQGEAEPQARKLEGTWRVQITIRNCQTGEALGDALPALVTFAQGGTLGSADTRFSPALRVTGLGVWRHTSGHTYSGVTEAFLFNTTGVWIGTQRITQTIEIGADPNEFNANAATGFFDPHGNPIAGFPPFLVCSTSVARRLE